MSTLATIQRIIADQTGVAVEELQPARPLEELGVDSLNVIESIFLIENEFKVEMPNPTVQVPIRTVQDIADIVDQLLLGREAEKTGPV